MDIFDTCVKSKLWEIVNIYFSHSNTTQPNLIWPDLT